MPRRRRFARIPEPLPARGVPGVCDEGYVTDGERLFRVIVPMDPRVGLRDAVLEDCATLAWHSYDAAELWALRLRPVAAPELTGRGRPRP